MVKLLVSVRSAAEARDAARAGADLIDIKEPSHGSLGRAEDAIISRILREVGSTPVSAALGDLGEDFVPCLHPGIRFVKLGLAGWASRRDWQKELDAAGTLQRSACPNTQLVTVAYADWDLAASPAPSQVIRFAVVHGWQGILVDTHVKNGRSLTQYLDPSELESIVDECRRHDRMVALAGSLRSSDIPVIASLRPDYVGVRGLVCREGNRAEAIDPAKVKRLTRSINSGEKSRLPQRML